MITMTPRTRLSSFAILAALLLVGNAFAAEQKATPPAATSDIWQVFEHRRSVRRFKPDPVPEADIRRILDAARLAPSSGNQQPWRFLVVRDPTKIAAMKAACLERAMARFSPQTDPTEGARERFKERAEAGLAGYFSAPVFIVVLTDNTSKYPDYNHWDGPLAAGQLMLAARALGYGTVFITDSIPDSVTKEVLGIPDSYTRVCITPLGVPVEWPESRPKKSVDELIAFEKL